MSSTSISGADEARERIATRLGVAAAIVAALAFALVMRDTGARRINTVSGPVAPDWRTEAADAREIRVETADGVLTLDRGGEGWRLRERDGYPVSPDALGTLDLALTNMQFSGARTQDPGNHARLGVVDPSDSDASGDASGDPAGTGTRLTVTNLDDERIIDLIIGDARNGGMYVRRPDADQTYAVDGRMPNLAAPATWLDLDFLPYDREAIAETSITPDENAAPYVLKRDTPLSSDFSLETPPSGWTLLTAGAGNGPGGATASLRFVDVRAAVIAVPDEGGDDVRASHQVTTFDGLVVRFDIMFDGDARWVSVTARGENVAAQADAEALAARTDGWEYRLPEYATDRLARPLPRIASPTDGAPDSPVEGDDDGDLEDN